MFAQAVSFPAAFLAGLLSFFSPCVLPLIPAYFTFITGFSLEELTEGRSGEVRSKVILSTIAYVAGFSFVFVLMGASASYLGGFIYNHRDVIRVVGGLLIVVLGIHLTGIIRISGLEFEKRIKMEKRPFHLMGTFLVGMAFGAGWSPCIGPLLGSILIVAGSQETVQQGMALLGIYSLGLAVPFIVISIFINYILVFMQKTTRFLKYVNTVAGVLLILVGLVLITNKMSVFSGLS